MIVGLFVEESQKKGSPVRRFAASLQADPGLIYNGVLRELPSEHNMSASEYSKAMGGYWRRHETGWYLIRPGKGALKPTVSYYPFPGRHYPRVFLERIALDHASEVTPEFQAMLNYFTFYESELWLCRLCYVVWVFMFAF